MRSAPEPDGSVGGSSVAGRDPWAGFGSGPSSSGHHPSSGNGSGPGDDRAVADLARRLQDRVDGQESLLDRVADLAQRPDDRMRVSELRDIARRLRRDSEALLLLCGADPGVHRGAPPTVPAVLDDAVALVDEPGRVVLHASPPATLAAAAAVELRHLLAEVVDEATAASPGNRIEVGARVDPGGALLVDVLVAGPGWSTASGPGRASAAGQAGRVAERLARRSTGGIRLLRPSVDDVDGLVATLHCPAHLVTARRGGPGDRPDPFLSAPPSGASAGTPSFGFPSVGASSFGTSSFGTPSFGTPSFEPSSVLLAPPPMRSRPDADELFGPLPTAVTTVETPIFEAVASAWFRDDEQAPADDWNSPGDREWRAAAARATRTDAPPTTTSSGLPQRSPGDRLVAPRAAGPARPAPDDRAPDRVRDRLATYQRGLRQGRHRAADPAATDPGSRDAAPEAWTAEGW